MKLRPGGRPPLSVWIRFRIEELRFWIGRHLPRGLVYHCALEVAIEATTGEWADTIVPELTLVDALERYRTKGKKNR